jgi:hypothetical protein
MRLRRRRLRHRWRRHPRPRSSEPATHGRRFERSRTRTRRTRWQLTARAGWRRGRRPQRQGAPARRLLAPWQSHVRRRRRETRWWPLSPLTPTPGLQRFSAPAQTRTAAAGGAATGTMGLVAAFSYVARRALNTSTPDVTRQVPSQPRRQPRRAPDGAARGAGHERPRLPALPLALPPPRSPVAQRRRRRDSYSNNSNSSSSSNGSDSNSSSSNSNSNSSGARPRLRLQHTPTHQRVLTPLK